MHGLVTGLMVAVLVYGLWAFWLFALKIGQPFPGILVGYERYMAQYVVGNITPDRWPGLESQRGVHKGDVILAIDGRPPKDFWQIYQDAAESGAGSVTMGLERDGRQWEADLPLIRFGWQEFGEAKLPYFIPGLALWLLGFAVYQAKPQASANRVFGLTTVGFSLLALGVFTTEVFSLAVVPIASLLPYGVVYPLLGALAGHLVTIFPVEDRRSRLFRYRYLWYVAATPIVMAMSYSYVYEMTHGGYAGAAERKIGSWAFQAIAVYMVVALLFSLIRYVYLYRTQQSTRVRQQIKILAYGVGLGILAPLIPLLIRGMPTTWDPTLSYYMALFFALAVAYAIMRYELFALPQTWAVSLAVGALTLLLAYALIMFLNLIVGWRINPLYVLAGAVLTSLFWRFDTPLRRPLARFLFPETYLYSVLNDLYRSAGAATAGRLDQLPVAIVRTLQQKLHRTYVALWAVQADGVQSVAQAGVLPAGLDPAQGAGLEALEDRPAAERLPIVWQERTIGCLLLGEKEMGEVPHAQEKEMLQIVAQQTALTLAMLEQVEDLRRVPRRITQAQEAERKRIGADLHDAVQSRLTGLKFTLASLERQVTPGSRAAELVGAGRAALQETAEELTAIRSNLTPEIVAARGLVTALGGLAQQVQARRGVAVVLEAGEGLEGCLDRAAQTELYRVFQQAVDNAVGHADPSRIEMRLRREGDRLLFEIADDGCGLPPFSLADLVAGGHYGLQSMADRVSLLGGTLAFEPRATGGTAVRGTIPLPRQ